MALSAQYHLRYHATGAALSVVTVHPVVLPVETSIRHSDGKARSGDSNAMMLAATDRILFPRASTGNGATCLQVGFSRGKAREDRYRQAGVGHSADQCHRDCARRRRATVKAAPAARSGPATQPTAPCSTKASAIDAPLPCPTAMTSAIFS